jgi:hypothetical protein
MESGGWYTEQELNTSKEGSLEEAGKLFALKDAKKQFGGSNNSQP